MKTLTGIAALLLFSLSSVAEPMPIKVRVTGWFSLRDGFGLTYRENVVMPVIPGAAVTPDRQYSLTCERALSIGVYEGTYDHGKNKLRLSDTDLKGKEQITNCKVFSHDWRAASK